MNWLKQNGWTIGIAVVAFAGGATVAALSGIPKIGKLKLAPSAG